jgi:hypothetical protein
MAKNNNLHAAKAAKNDEFYTRYEDISKEIQKGSNGYRPFFKDKVVYCNCDDPERSNFWKYFKDVFDLLHLKKLIFTHYDPKGESNYKFEYDGKKVVKTKLEGNGDFRSEECIELLKQSDIVVTNPPFSLFREYIELLMKHNKKFAIIGNKNAITYKEIFPLIKDNKLWLGYSSPSKFITPGGEITNQVNGLCRWYTNLDIPKRHEPIESAWEYEKGKKLGLYPKYDNYDAINIDKVCQIPLDYDGVMGVPITFLDRYCPEQFEIVAFRKGDDGKDLVFSREREREFNRTFESLSREDKVATANVRGWSEEILQNIDQGKIELVDLFYPPRLAIMGVLNHPNETLLNGQHTYKRILIRRKSENN